MDQTPSKMHMHDMVTIDTIVFEIVGGVGGGAFKTTPPGSLTFSNTPDQIGLIFKDAIDNKSLKCEKNNDTWPKDVHCGIRNLHLHIERICH